MYEAKILLDSVSSAGTRLITFEVNYPHAVHKDIMTHRWARNFQSFRAVPPETLLERLGKGEYFTPEVFGHRTKGMGQRNEPVEGEGAIDQEEARLIWEQHVHSCIAKAHKFLTMGIAKQQVNFLLQDLCFIRGIITTTRPKLRNFFGLRTSLDPRTGQPFARPEVYKIAKMMQDAFEASTPRAVAAGDWHLPLIDQETIDWVRNFTPTGRFHKDFLDTLIKISVGRCARISYLTHDGRRDPLKDIQLHDQLLTDGHMSPFEHQGQAIAEPWFDALQVGSFEGGWRQYRKMIPNEHDYTLLRKGT